MLKNVYDIERPPHPGEILREDLMPAYDVSQRVLAEKLKVGRSLLRSFLKEKRSITPDLAQRLGCVFGQGPQYWLGLQLQYDLWVARSAASLDLEPLVRPTRQSTRRTSSDRVISSPRSPGSAGVDAGLLYQPSV